MRERSAADRLREVHAGADGLAFRSAEGAGFHAVGDRLPVGIEPRPAEVPLADARRGVAVGTQHFGQCGAFVLEQRRIPRPEHA